MKLKENYPMVEMDGESIIVFAPNDDKSFRGMLKLNDTGRFVLDCLVDETDESLILQKLMEQFDGAESDMREDISMVLDKLRVAGALEE